MQVGRHGQDFHQKGKKTISESSALPHPMQGTIESKDCGRDFAPLAPPPCSHVNSALFSIASLKNLEGIKIPW